MRGNFKYANPWYDQGPGRPKLGPEVYDRRDVVYYESECGRGKIVKVSNVQFDYLVNGKVVSQLAGKKPETLNDYLACCLDGAKPRDWFTERAKNIYTNQAA